jgi:hypothetical protein
MPKALELFLSLLEIDKETLAYGLILAAVAVFGQVIVAVIKNRHSSETHRISADEALARHNSEISIRLLSELRKDLDQRTLENRELSKKVERARILVRHLDAILLASNAEARAQAEMEAKIYLETVRPLL